jgi:hypothetical protein
MRAGRARELTMKLWSVEAQIIGDALESRTSIPNACWLANSHCKETGEDSLCIVPVHSIFKILNPSVQQLRNAAKESC